VNKLLKILANISLVLFRYSDENLALKLNIVDIEPIYESRLFFRRLLGRVHRREF